MVPKIAAIAMTARILMVPMAPLVQDWVQIVAFIAAASMIWGAVAGVAQCNVKRLLAYSSIGNIGFALLGLVVASEPGLAAMTVFMMIYLIMTTGVFAIILGLRRDGHMIEQMDDFAGLSVRAPVAAYMLAILLLSMAAIPPLAGFLGKLMVFNVVVAAGYIPLAVIGVIASVVAAYYYLRVIKIMFFDPVPDHSPDGSVDITLNRSQKYVAGFCVLCVVGLVFYPGPVIDAARYAVPSKIDPKVVAAVAPDDAVTPAIADPKPDMSPDAPATDLSPDVTPAPVAP
jgi:NADH-quinone oxidoreductase subunit N